MRQPRYGIMTPPSSKAFMAGIIDYAGLFPPASLALDAAVSEFLAHRAEDKSWILARFICSDAGLEKLVTQREKFLATNATPVSIAVTLGGGKTEEDFHSQIKKGSEAIKRFNQGFSPAGVVDLVEIRLSAALLQLENESGMVRVLHRIWDILNPECETVFLELQLAEANVAENHWGAYMARFIRALSEFNRDRASPHHLAGFKLRTGGLVKSDFPSLQTVVLALIGCRDHRVLFKATAGLHHPVRLYSSEVQTEMHGFLNIFGGGALAYSRSLNPEALLEIVADTNKAHFSFAGDFFGWKDLRLSAQEIQEARQRAVRSFGSCSFREPIFDMQELGFL